MVDFFLLIIIWINIIIVIGRENCSVRKYIYRSIYILKHFPKNNSKNFYSDFNVKNKKEKHKKRRNKFKIPDKTWQVYRARD